MNQTPEQLEKDIRETRENYVLGLTELASLVGSHDNAKGLMSRVEEFGIEAALESGEGDLEQLRPKLESLLQVTHRLDLLIGERERSMTGPDELRTVAMFGEEVALSDLSGMEAVEPRSAPDPSFIEALEGKSRSRRRGRNR